MHAEYSFKRQNMSERKKKAEKLCSTGCVKDQKLKITMETPAHDGTLAHLEIFHPP